MAESVPTMDNSDEVFYDVSDPFLKLHRGEGEKSPPASQTDYAPSPGQVAALNAERKASQSVTEPNPPVQIAVYQATTESLSLRWDTPAGEVESYIVTCCHEADVVLESTDTNTLTLSHLKPGVCYSLRVSTQLRNGRISKPAVTSAQTKTHLESLLGDLGLEDRLKEKLSLSTILQIDKKTITDEPPKCNADLPWNFLKKLMMVN
ncbi:Up-regulator of cell proliferation [Liparis tanakae]|uniref:Up-regulator of cell proliferation n=1 Tax=Liparis tanakae TaxID=230148 RepID=A0A4Z2FJ28_9TELE|nr:Up-regulator of cell proliferation [Liparis tanakae]